MLAWHEYPKEEPKSNTLLLLRTDENIYKTGKYLNGHFDTYHIITHFAEFNQPIIEEEVVVKKRGRPKKT